MVRVITTSLYFLNGALFLAAGVGVLLMSTPWLPRVVREHIVHAVHGDGRTLHLLQEVACLLVFAGLMVFWCVWNSGQSRWLHWALTLFWALFAWVHWFDPTGQFHTGTDQLKLSIPFAVFAVLGLLRR